MSRILSTHVNQVDTLVHTGPCEYWGAHYQTVVTDSKGIVYDGIDTNGTIIDVLRSAQNTAEGEQFFYPVECQTGIYVDVSGSTLPRLEVWWSS